MSDIERERFEAWFIHQHNITPREWEFWGKRNEDGSYAKHDTGTAWRAWQAAKQDVGECEWSENEDGQYNTSCLGVFEVTEGTPEENKFKFCCYCGGVLKQKLFESSKEQS